MLFTTAHLAQAAIVAAAILIIGGVFRHKFGIRLLLCLAVLIAWCGVFSVNLSGETPTLTEPVRVTALNTHSEQSGGNHIVIDRIHDNVKEIEIPHPSEGSWAYWSDGKHWYCGWLPDYYLQPAKATQSIVLDLPIGRERSITFLTRPWYGIVKVGVEGTAQTVDTYGKESSTLTLPLPDSSKEAFNRNQWHQMPYFCIIFAIWICGLSAVAAFAARNGRMMKIDRYRFLFSELVKRDFTLKYKRTILGMLWSVISPLINLIIMWLVFSEMLGSNINHFVIYMFAGQLVFSYFSDSTMLGMTSLLDNASIFTKVNVPKYMFLLSKNVSSLINFGLTLIILFVFVAIEGLPFTGNYLMLIFPIGFLILFNIGMGLILSALFVFFRDMQYLWGIISQLIMWISAIFYSVESFNQINQNLFQLNPVYLFILYFRKIVIDNAVPSVWFHLLIAAYTLLVFGVGCWMYKKYNHEFLYYV